LSLYHLSVILLQIKYLSSIGLQQDEICNMASISVVLLGLNPETRIRWVWDHSAGSFDLVMLS
jgi:hypothetical protein